MESNEHNYYNPKTKKMENMWEQLVPVYTVRYENPTCGNKGMFVQITVEAANQEEAKEKAIMRPEFIEHIQKDCFDRQYLEIHHPVGLYVIGRVEYSEGDQRA